MWLTRVMLPHKYNAVWAMLSSTASSSVQVAKVIGPLQEEEFALQSVLCVGPASTTTSSIQVAWPVRPLPRVADQSSNRLFRLHLHVGVASLATQAKKLILMLLCGSLVGWARTRSPSAWRATSMATPSCMSAVFRCCLGTCARVFDARIPKYCGGE